MAHRNDSTDQRQAKPAKPHPDFPLTPHPTGRWCKKVRGKVHFFGPWRDPDGALVEWLRVKDDLLAGRKPRPKGQAAGVTIKYLVDAYLTRKEQHRDNGEIKPRTFLDCRVAGVRAADAFGRERVVSDLTADDFAALRDKLAKTKGPVALGVEIQRIRSIFKWGYEDGILDNPVRFGTGFKKPSAKTLRIDSASRGARDLQADEIRKLIDAADVTMKAMILLGVNCGMGNHDVATLPKSGLSLTTGWLDYPRPKTGVPRRAKLWPETVAAINAAIAIRPNAKNADDNLVFITRNGNSWGKDGPGNNPVYLIFSRLLKDCKLHRPGVGFYSLRRTFETVAGATADQVAVDHVMGHAPHVSDMGARYRQRIEDNRLEAVAEHVRVWLFGEGGAK
ncbi:MAG: tyrosine-type recombinase/integrase [Saprospiraceae bacterium]